MTRQAAVAGGATAGASRQPRLDPLTLPVRYTATIGPRGRRVAAEIYLDRKTVVVVSQKPSSLDAPLTMRLPVSAYDGVAVRMSPKSEGGDIEVVVELMHRDPGLSLPLRLADDPAEVADDWQAWGEMFDLPLVLIDQDGRMIEADGRTATSMRLPPKSRRRHSFFADRRPRFLTRRKQGRPGGRERLAGHEMIARN